jgi:solute carrier family 45, member 1/2/4
MARYPLLLYTSVYIGDLYKRANPLAYGNLDIETLHKNALARDAEATRLGSRALFYSSGIALILIWLLPVFVATPASQRSRSSRNYRPVSTNITESVGGADDDIEDDRHQHRRRPPAVQHGDVTKWEILSRTFQPIIREMMKIDLVTLWAFGHFTFALCMFGTL